VRFGRLRQLGLAAAAGGGRKGSRTVMGQKSSGPGALMSWRKNENEKEFILTGWAAKGRRAKSGLGWPENRNCLQISFQQN
jgi:hypothetical protein